MISLGVFSLRRRSVSGSVLFSLLMFSGALVSIFYYFEITPLDLNLKTLALKLQYFGIATITLFWFLLAAHYCGLRTLLKPKYIAMLSIIPAVTVLFAWTNPLHHFLWTEINTYRMWGLLLLDNSYGFWFWIHVAYTYSTFIIGTILFIRFAVTTNSLYRSQVIAFLIAAVFPWVGNIIFTFRLFAISPLDTTPISFAISGIALWWAIFRYSLLDVMPAAKEAALDHMGAGIIIVDKKERIVAINPYIEKTFLLGSALVTGEPVRIILNNLKGTTNKNRKTGVITGELSYQGETDTFYFDLHKTPIVNRKGGVTGHLYLLFDITERKKTELALHHTEHLLFQSQKMEALGRLASGIAHDFNNILTTIGGYTDLLRAELPDAEEHIIENLEEIKIATDRGTELTRQLLTFSKKRVVEKQYLSIDTVLIDMRKMLERIIGNDIDFEMQHNGFSGTIQANRSQIEQVILNLAINAKDAMPEGGKLLIKTGRTYLNEFFCASRGDILPGTYSLMEVIDTGNGIDEFTAKNIFEPFFTTKGEGKGTGLGLSTVYGIVKQNRGHIEVESKKGEGSCFRVFLPVADSEYPHGPRQ